VASIVKLEKLHRGFNVQQDDLLRRAGRSRVLGKIPDTESKERREKKIWS
jgi:hypothetical protein